MPILNITKNCKTALFKAFSVTADQVVTTTSATTTATFKSYQDLPGPKPLPYIGNMLDLKVFGGQYDLMNYPAFNIQLQAQYGDVVKWNLFRGDEVFLFRPEHIKAAFKLDGSKPLRSLMTPWLMMQEQLGISKSLLNSNGKFEGGSFV